MKKNCFISVMFLLAICAFTSCGETIGNCNIYGQVTMPSSKIQPSQVTVAMANNKSDIKPVEYTIERSSAGVYEYHFTSAVFGTNYITVDFTYNGKMYYGKSSEFKVKDGTVQKVNVKAKEL